MMDQKELWDINNEYDRNEDAMTKDFPRKSNHNIDYVDNSKTHDSNWWILIDDDQDKENQGKHRGVCKDK